MTTTEDKIEWLINNLSTPDMAIVEEVIDASRKDGYDEGRKEGYDLGHLDGTLDAAQNTAHDAAGAGL